MRFLHIGVKLYASNQIGWVPRYSRRRRRKKVGLQLRFHLLGALVRTFFVFADVCNVYVDRYSQLIENHRRGLEFHRIFIE